MHIILVPGMWLDGSAWADVAEVLAEAGHGPLALTLPGMESVEADRSGIRLRDHVDAVVAAIDAVGEGADEPPKVLLVGHSAAAGIAWSAVDARPGRVARAVLVSGFPGGDGEALAAGFYPQIEARCRSPTGRPSATRTSPISTTTAGPPSGRAPSHSPSTS